MLKLILAIMLSFFICSNSHAVEKWDEIFRNDKLILYLDLGSISKNYKSDDINVKLMFRYHKLQKDNGTQIYYVKGEQRTKKVKLTYYKTIFNGVISGNKIYMQSSYSLLTDGNTADRQTGPEDNVEQDSLMWNLIMPHVNNVLSHQ